MKNWAAYRLLLRCIPPTGSAVFSDLTQAQTRILTRILRRHRCLGASLCLFDEKGVAGRLAFGEARPGVPAQIDTVFRAASVSKFVTGLGILKLREQGLDIDRDVNVFLPFPLRHPKAPDVPVTLRMLMTHTAALRDGKAYNEGIVREAKLSEILSGDSFADHLPGTAWEYSNLGAGIIGSVIEGATGTDFETVMQLSVFAPLHVTATYYPQKAQGTLADARRILPPHRGPNFDAEKRRQKPLPPAAPDPEHHYNLAHGSLCVSAEQLAKLGIAAMTPGFLTEKSLRDMRRIAVPFGERARNLSQGLSTFVLQDAGIGQRPIYGHQGMAYGAVHGLFFDPETKKGAVLLTYGASEARRGVLADLNFDILRAVLGGEKWIR